MAGHGYPPEFRRRVLDLVAAGKKISEVAHDLASASSRSTPGVAKTRSIAAFTLGLPHMRALSSQQPRGASPSIRPARASSPAPSYSGVFSRRVVGWSIDPSPTAALTTNARGMAIDGRRPKGTVIRSDQGTQFTSWAVTRRALDSGLVPSMGPVVDCYDCDDRVALLRSA